MFLIILQVLLVVVVATGVIPVSTGSFQKAVVQPVGYDSAMSWVAGTRKAESATVDTMVAATFVMSHGRKTGRVIIFYHGLTNNPAQFRWLADSMYRRGANVLVPLLPHHGRKDGDVGKLAKLSAEELQALANTSINVARGLGDTVDVLGLSAGGVVAAWVAQFRRDVRRSVVVAPALALHGVPELLWEPVTHWMVRLPNITIRQHTDVPPGAYSGFSTHGVGEMMLFGQAAYDGAGNKTPAVPSIVVVTNANDGTVSNGRTADLVRRWQDHKGEIRQYMFDAQYKLAHDVVDPRQPYARPDIVYPVLIALLNGEPEAPPPRTATAQP